MRIARLHPWSVSPREAAAIQRRLARRIVLHPPPRHRVRLVAGLDCAYAGGRAYAAAVVMRVPVRGGAPPVETALASLRTPFPYIPGLLSFREAPVLARVLRRLRSEPDLLLVDGQGIAHPRRMGLACHVGLLAGVPAVGVAKSLLVGGHEPPPRPSGSWSPLVHRGETVGTALRLRDGGNPVFVSPGHLCDPGSALRWVLACAAGHRLPEPVFLADRIVGEAAARARGSGPLTGPGAAG